jgi:hypothetical protein
MARPRGGSYEQENAIMLSFRKRIVAAGAALAAAISVAGTPVYASLTLNSLTHNALVAGGSAIDDLNGVMVEAVRRDPIDGVDPDRGDKSGEIVIYQLSQVNPGQ